MKRKVLGMLLALCMVLSLLPATALAADTDITVNVDGQPLWATKPGVYFATVSEGVPAAVTPAAGKSEPDDWQLMLDSTLATPELTLKNAVIGKPIAISGAGALKIILKGESSVSYGSEVPLSLTMGGGTTITSHNDGHLLVEQTGTGNKYGLLSGTSDNPSNLTLDHANLTVALPKYNNSYAYAALTVVGELNVVGGNLTAKVGPGSEKYPASASGISSSVLVSISGGANVTITKETAGSRSMSRPAYGIKTPVLNFGGGKLTITDGFPFVCYTNPTAPERVYHSRLIGNQSGKSWESADVLPTFVPVAEGDRMEMKLGNSEADAIVVSDITDYGTYRYLSLEYICTCADANNDHNCDKCGKKMSECADADNDQKCDVCGKAIASAPACDHSTLVQTNCTEAVICSKCGETVIAAKEHKFTDDKDTTCDNEGCKHTRVIDNPTTGDTFSVVLVATLALASLATLAVTVIGKKRAI